MDDALYEKLLGVMLEADLSEDSSAELAFHLALHYPSHAAAILAYDASSVEAGGHE